MNKILNQEIKKILRVQCLIHTVLDTLKLHGTAGGKKKDSLNQNMG